ncbi:pikAII [Symbiodinium natans]|uniref:PikAII protein n=1 Tax=Symbiodinium natans TaxID=878477 RepID=A0A812V490_9DINO|nr:pikAII [Symbiodinium natans]
MDKEEELRIPDFHELEPRAACDRVGRLLRQRGACLIPLAVPEGSLGQARQEIVRHRLEDRLTRTPRQVASAYFGKASGWTMQLSPPTAEVPEGQKALRFIDASLEGLGGVVAAAARLHLARTVSSRSAALVHHPTGTSELDQSEDEVSEDEASGDDRPLQEKVKQLGPQEVWRHILHCGRRKVVMLVAFQPTSLQLKPRAKAYNPVQLELREGEAFIYLHDACFLHVSDDLTPGPLLQVDLKIERPRDQRTEELLDVPQPLIQLYSKLLEATKESPGEEVGLRFLRDAHLQTLRGVGIASLHVELPSVCLQGSGPTPLAACLLGGLDTATAVAPPPPMRRQFCERQFYGAKWDLNEYFGPDGEASSEMYCKHLSVLYRSYGISDFDYRYFGMTAMEANNLDPRCLLLLEGHTAALHAAGTRDSASASRPFGVFSGLCSGLGFMSKSNPSVIVGQVSEPLNFTGPIMNLDAGDASSLLAVERAVVSLRKAECEAALASSAHWINGPGEVLALCRDRLISRSGQTRVFDAAADGFVPGEGVVVCMLSPQGAGDSERSCIVGVGVKSSGKASNLKAPHAPSVTELLAKAARDSALPLAILDAVEASAGGIPAADTSELALLGKALQHRDGGQPVVVSCAKASFGHAGPTSGLVGMARSLLLLGRGLHGPQLHLRVLPGAKRNGDSRSMHIPTEVVAGRHASQIFGVSSFGSSGLYAHHLVLAEPPSAPSKASHDLALLWWPNRVKRKDHGLVYRGYYLQGTMTTWSEGLRMTRVSGEDEIDTFEGYVRLEGDYPESFQIWVDEDPDKALHPPSRGSVAEAPVLGPAAAPRSLCWQIGKDGRAGDGYRIWLQVNGKLRRVAWTKLRQASPSLFGTPCPHGFSIIGDHNAWTFGAMLQEPDGSFSAEVQLLKALSNFQIFRDADFEQGFYPKGATPDESDGTVQLSGEDILGPDPHGHGYNFQVAGQVGAIFRVVFSRRAGSSSISWKQVGWRAVDFQEIVKSHTYFVAGSWDSFASCKEMVRDSCGNWSVEVTLQKNVETFQILLNRNWFATVHPDVSRAVWGDDFRVEGPDEAGHGKYFCLGAGCDALEAGLTALIKLEIQDGFPSRVSWERSDSDRAHELRIAAGLGKFSERHLRLLGLIPWNEETGAEPRFNDQPDWWNEGHLSFSHVVEARQKKFEDARRTKEARDTPENELAEKLRELASLA